MKNKTSIYCIALVIVFLYSCTVQKRIYQKGYYVSYNKQSIKPKKQVEDHKDVYQLEFEKAQEFLATSEKNSGMFLKEHTSNSLIDLNSGKQKMLPIDTCTDILVLKDGKELKVQVVEVRSNMIKYKPCGGERGPIAVIPKEDIASIKHLNGTYSALEKEDWEKPVKNNSPLDESPSYSNLTKPKLNGFALASLLCSLFSFLILPGIIAIILGIVAIVQFNKNPERYKGEGLAVLGIIISLVLIAIMISVMISFSSTFGSARFI